jgi:RNA recognition motif-containing protein
MTVKLFIGNLSFKATEANLEELFSQAGQVVSTRVITDRETGRPRGFGFVEMASKEEADRAIQMFNNYSLVGRAIAVNEARPRENAGGGGGYSGGGRSGGYGGGGRERGGYDNDRY